MSGRNEVKVLIARNKKKKRSGFVVEESDDGRYYFSKIPSDCRQVSVGDQVREINGIRWLDIEDEEHANEILDDPAVEYIALSVIPKPDNLPVADDDDDDDDDDDVDEAEDEDDSVVSGGDSDSEDVSIATDVEDEYDHDNNVVRKSASTRPSQARKSAEQRLSNSSDIHVSDASDDDDEDAAHYNYAQETARREGDLQSRRSTTTSKNDDGYGQKGRVSDAKQKARQVINTRDSSNEEKLDPAKEAERDRARAIKQRREQEKLEAAAERRRKDELAEQLKDAEAHGKKIQRAKVTVERNIGAYSLGSPPTSKKPSASTPKKPSTSTPKKPSSNSGGGWSKVTTAPRPSSSGWNKVSISSKK